MRIFLSVLALLSSCSTAFAEVTPSYFSTMEANMPSSPQIISFGYIMQLILSLGVVFGAIYITGKYLLPKLSPGTKGNFINVVDRVVLEPSVTSYILNVDKKSWLVVVSNKNATVVDELEGFEV